MIVSDFLFDIYIYYYNKLLIYLISIGQQITRVETKETVNKKSNKKFVS